MNSDNKQVIGVALITGAARRIGAEIAKTLHHAGYRVIIHCHQSLTKAHTLADSLNALRPDSACVLTADLSQMAEIPPLVDAAIDWAGRLTTLINNASLFTASPLNAQTLKNQGRAPSSDCQRLYAVNVFAPWHLSLYARPWLAQDAGSIINLTDIHAKKPLKGYAEYCQSKAALTMQTLSLAREFAPEIRVNAIAPGAILWPEEENALPEAVKNQIIRETPLNKHGNPVFIAQAVLALLNNPFITGETLRVDGGRFIV